MEEKLFVGVGRVGFYFRQARSLKDKRSILQRIKQRLRNEGWSVVELSFSDDFKRGFLGFCYASSSATHLDNAFQKASELFIGNFEIFQKEKDSLEFSVYFPIQ